MEPSEESSQSSKSLSGRASALAYLLIFFHGALCGMLSVIVKPCAKAIGITYGEVVFTYSLFSLASTTMIQVTSSLLLPRMRVSSVLSWASGLLSLSGFLFFKAHDQESLSWAFVFLGLGLGMAFATANFLLVSHYQGRERSSKLALLNFFYCVGAVLTPALGGRLLEADYPWQYVFLWPIIVCLLGTIFSYLIPAKPFKEDAVKARFRDWPFQVYVIAAALTLFSIAEVTFTNWLNVDGEDVMKLSTEQAADLASLFWLVVGVGRFSASRILLKVPGKVFVCLSCLCAGIGFLLYTRVTSYTEAILAVTLIGLGVSAVNPTLVSMGSAFSRSPALLGALLTVGSLGPVIAPVTSQWVYTNYGSYTNTLTSLGFLAVVIVLIAFTTSAKDEEQFQQKTGC